MPVWHPDAKRVPYSDAGPYVAAAPKIVWHTTETQGLPIYSGSAPHFTFNPATGSLWQHIPINRSAKSLEHPSGTVETNHANCVQVELIGYAKDTGEWPASQYARIAKLARWIEANHGVPSTCGVNFVSGTLHLPDSTWLSYAGHLGHQHVPNNHHWDPGLFKIGLVLDTAPERKRRKWARHLASLRRQAKRYGWTKPRRVLGRQLKRLLSR